MTRLRTIAAWILLAAYAVGGGIGPILHHAQHAVERAAAEEHTHAGTNGPVWCGTPVQVQTLDCAVCTSRSLVGPPSFGQSAAVRVETTGWGTTRSHLRSTAVVVAPFIRGPPPVG